MNELKLLENFIRTVVEETVKEIAVRPDEAASQKVGLSIFNTGDFVHFVLFNTAKFVEFCNTLPDNQENPSNPGSEKPTLSKNNSFGKGGSRNLSKNNNGFGKGGFRTSSISGKGKNSLLEDQFSGWAVVNLLEEFPNPVVGYIRIKKSECGWVVHNSAAERGYGPLLYDIAMSYAGKTGLMPDRVEGVSRKARNIWKYYATQRQNDVRVYPLRKDDECAVFSDENDSWFLDARYVSRNPNQADLNGLKANAAQAQSSVDRNLNIEKVLIKLARHFFDLKYGGGSI
jgi:hypothetical protein